MDGEIVNDQFFRQAIDSYSDMIFRISLQYVGNTQDAEDVVQEVLMGLVEYLSLAPFESDEHMRAWLIRITINKSINVSKSNSRRRRREKADFFSKQGGDAHYENLECALEKLSALDREAVYLHYYEGYSAKEIAVFLHKTEKSVFKRLSRARNKLKVFLSEGEA